MKKEKKIKQLISSQQPVLLHFYRKGSRAIPSLQTTLDAFSKTATDPNLILLNLEVKKVPDLVSEWEVEGAPSLLFFSNGEEKWRLSGTLPSAHINRMLQSCNQPQ
ncbi:MAG: thioredoxin family protein [Bacteroidota bacterium]